MLRLSRLIKGLQLHVATGQIATREYLESFEPKGLKRLKVFDSTPPEDLKSVFFEKLSSNYSNPRSILRLYRKYIAVDDYPCYSWLVRCLGQLGNSFSFNSFWSPSDRQALTCMPLFKYLIYDLIERRHFIQARHVPRLIFALAALEYRCWPLLSHLLPMVEKHAKDWSVSAICCMFGCLTLLGISNLPQCGILDVLLDEILTRDVSTATTFDWALLAYGLVLTNRYEWPRSNDSFLPLCLSRVCNDLTLENLPYSGWIQYILYLVLYCTDVEKPKNELKIKQSVPYDFQESLHIRWLNEIVIHAQNQGSEWMQKDVDKTLQGMGIKEALINCSVGRNDDEQHCLFAGHLFPNRKLCVEYNYLKQLPDGAPVESGIISFKRRMFNKLGYNVVVMEKGSWDALEVHEKEQQLSHILNSFPKLQEADYESQPEPMQFAEGKDMKHYKHLRPQFTTWPPEKVTV